MRYQSIIRFLDYCQADYADVRSINISRLKKQIAAEFAMDADGIISIDSVNYSKNDVFAEIERPDFAERLTCHLQIWNDKSLLDFLETGTVDLKKATWENLNENENFVAFLSPYFAEPYSNVMKIWLQNIDWQNAVQWLSYQHFILPNDEEMAYKSIRDFANDSLRMFRNLNKANYYSKKSELKLWAKNGCAAFFNNLPDCLYFLSDEFARALINASVELQKVEKKICYYLSRQLIKFKNISPGLKDLITNNHKIFAKKSGYGIGIRLPNLLAFFWAAFIVVRIIIGISFFFTNNHAPYTISDSSAHKYIQILEDIANKNKLTMQNMANFRKMFLENKINTGKGAEKLAQEPFNNNEYVYLMFENSSMQGSSIFPVNIINQTNHAIVIYIVNDSDLIDMRIDAKQALNIKPSGKILDILLEEKYNTADTALLSLNQIQFIHLANSSASSITNNPMYNDNDTLDVACSEPAKSTLTVKARDGYLYFDVSKNLHVLGFRL